MGTLDFENVTPENLKHYQRVHKESEYQLIDVRQPDEYTEGHIPGARLMPLDELEERLSELPQKRDIVFYCRSGARSQAAAIIALDDNPALKKIYNLMGGFMAWDGQALMDFPKVEVFATNTSLSNLMYLSMDLEKAAQRFYMHMHAHHSADSFAETFNRLSKAEEAHARVIYKHWAASVASPKPFDELYGELSGEIIEGGEPLLAVVERMDAAGDRSCIGLMELAMTIEVQAYDLYRTMADQNEDTTVRDAFLSIAQMEKKHMQMLAKAIRQC